MIEALEVQFKTEGLIIAKLKKVRFPAHLVLSKNITPVRSSWQFFRISEIEEDIVLKIGGKEKRFNGVMIVDSESSARQFLLKHAVMEKDKIDTLLERISGPFRRRELRDVYYRGKTYFIENEHLRAGGGVLCAWTGNDRTLDPIVVGREYERYYYMQNIDAEKGIVNFRLIESVKELPENIKKGLTKGYIYCDSNNELVGHIPFPPFDVKFAVKLPHLSALLKAKEEPVPEDLHTPFIVKTFLPVPNIPVLKLSPGVLKSVASKITGSVYDPEFPNPHWVSDYKFIFERSAGYLLFTKIKTYNIRDEYVKKV
jgi:hypothetical protein